MRQSIRKRNTQRRLVDRRLSEFPRGPLAELPRHGWLRAVRESLGLSAAQLASRVGVSVSTLLELEKRERSGKVALETLRRAARAMGCDVVYAIVPTEASTLEALVQQRAQQAARRMVARTEASMKLEDQGVHRDETLAQESELAEALKESLSPALWEEPR